MNELETGRRIMQLPTIHLNGTSKERLIEALCNASDALNEAYAALKQTAPKRPRLLPARPRCPRPGDHRAMGRLRRLDEIKKPRSTSYALTMAIDEVGRG